jgi:hypothetical protein
MGTTPRQTPDMQPAIDQLRALAAHSGDRLLLADGPPNPDAALLDLCADIAQQRKVTDAASEQWRFKPGHDKQLYEEIRVQQHHLTVLLKRASRIQATTASGIYAKAIAVASSKGGAAGLGMTLAQDLIDNPALRACLWPADIAQGA